MTAKLIVLEGPDGIGKSLICEMLQQRIENSVLFAFPGNVPGTIGHLIYDVHHNPENYELKTVDPTAVQALHVAAHIDAISTQILPALKSDRTVILDRYNISTWVYGIMTGANMNTINHLINAEEVHWAQCGVEEFETMFFYVDADTPYREEQETEAWFQIRDHYRYIVNAMNENDAEGGIERSIYVIRNDVLEATIEIIMALIAGEPVVNFVSTEAVK